MEPIQLSKASNLKLFFFSLSLFICCATISPRVFAQDCTGNVPTFNVDLTGQPAGSFTTPPTTRLGNCCGTTSPDRCIRFIITLDPDAVGINFQITGGAIPPGALFYQINCGPQQTVGQYICITGVGPHVLTFCKPGNNENTFTVTSVSRPLFPDPHFVRAGCNLEPVLGLIENTLVWNSIAPGALGQYNSWLSCTTGCSVPTFTPPAGATFPEFIDYYVCGSPQADQCGFIQQACDTVRIFPATPIIGTVTPSPATFCPTASGVQLSAQGSGGVPPYTYVWRNPSNVIVGTNASYFATSAGTYTVTIQDAIADRCPSIVVNVPVAVANIQVITSSTEVSCFGGNDGTASVIVSGGTGPYIVQWSPGNLQGLSITGLQAGTYNFTVTDQGGCTANGSVTVTQPTQLVASASSPLLGIGNTNLACFGDNNGTASITVSGGSPPYAFEWSNGADTQTVNNLTAGTYTATVSDLRGCSIQVSVTLTQPNPLSALLSSPTFNGGFNIGCNGGNNGSINAAANGGVSPYNYAWTGPQPANGNNPSGLVAGTYTLNLTDGNNCAYSDQITLTEPTLLVASINNSTNVLCHGQSTGSATALAQGGVGPYTYQWNSSPVQLGATAQNLPAGTYTVTITDANGCTDTESVTITQPNAPLSTSTSQVNVLCFGNATGSATVVVNGGTPGHQYSWNTNPVQTTATASGLTAGVYQVLVTDNNGCTITASVTITQPVAPLSLSISNTTNVGCFGENTGIVAVQATGGTPGYSYSWNTNPVQTGPVATGLTAGTYTVSVTDNNNCTTSIQVTVNQPAAPLSIALQSQTNVLCFGQSTGAATVVANGGTSGYSYSWNTSPPTVGATLANAPAGTYTVTATDANNCTAQFTLSITQPATPLQASITSVQPVLCFGQATGSATVTASGGTPGYTYLWNDPAAQTTATATGLAAGNYSVIVTDNNGCSGVVNVTITQPQSILSGTIVSQTNVACFGNATGAATVLGSGGSGSYSYLWAPGGQTTSTVSGLLAGTYNVAISDNNGCNTPFNIQVVITQPDAGISATLTSPTVIGGWNIACNGDATGAINLLPIGGTGEYHFTWYLANGDTVYTQNLTNLIAGTYTVIIGDDNECTLTQNITLTQPNAIGFTFEMTPSLCFGSNEGTLNVDVFGGTPAYGYDWTGPDGFTATDQTSFTELFGGIYEMTVTDINGCEFYSPVTVTQPEDIVLSLDNISLYPGGWNVACWNSTDGSIEITASGGTTEYNFVWQGPNNPFFATTQNVSNVGGGIYEVILIDANNCIQNLFIEVDAPDSLFIDLNAFEYPGGAEISCVGASDGSITSLVEGGTPDYSYNWSGPIGFPGAITENLNNLPEGTYLLEVTDINGCISQLAVRIDPPDSLLLDIFSPTFFGGFNITCNGANTGSIELYVEGGVPNYSVQWNGPNGYQSTDVNIYDLFAGEYCATVSDINGCEEIICITLTEPQPLTANLNSPEYEGGWNINCHGTFTGNIETLVQGGVAPFDFFWDGPGFYSSNDQNPSDLEAGEHCVSVVDANNCLFEVCITLTEPEPLEINLNASNFNGSGVSCNGATDGSITTSIDGGTEEYNYSWTGPGNFQSSDANLNEIGAGTYCLTVSDANGCSTQQCINLTETQPLSVTLIPSVFAGGFNIACNGGNSGTLNAIAANGTPGYQYSWTGPNGFSSSQANLAGLTAGVYCVEVTDLNGCTVTNCMELTEPLPLDANPVVNPVACNSAATGSINLNLTGGVEPYTIIWSNSANTQNISGLDAGIYTVVVLDANNCLWEESFEILQPEALQLSLIPSIFVGGNNIDCFGNATGTLTPSLFGGTEPYLYAWTGPNGFTSTANQISGLVAGTYCLTVIDDNNCEAEACFTLNQPQQLAASITQTSIVLCQGTNTGSLQASSTGGNPSYGFVWTGPNGYTATGPNAQNVGAGEYCVTSTDVNGCTAVACFTVSEPELLTLQLIPTEVEGGFNITCFGASTGSASAIPSGGSGSYSYSWTGPNGFTSNAANPTELSAGEYCVTVTDVNGCTESECIILTQPELLEVTMLPQTFVGGVNISCFGECDGIINTQVSGGAGPFTYSWTGTGGVSGNDNSLGSLCIGTYNVQVVDANGCTANSTVTLTQPEPLIVSGTVFNATCDAADGAINITVSGGSGAYTFNWEHGPTSQDIINVPADTYTVVVTDANGCSTQVSFDVDGTNAVQLILSAESLLCYNDSTGSISAEVLNATPPVNYSWTGPNGFNSSDPLIVGLSAGEYSLTVTDNNNCSATALITVSQPDSLFIDPLVSPFPVSGVDNNISTPGGNDGSILALGINGGSGNMTAVWSGPNGYITQGTQGQNGLFAGIYSVLVIDENGCSATQSITLTEPLDLELPNGISPNGDGINDGLIVNGLEVYPENEIIIFNRWGNIVYQQNNYSNQYPWFGENMKGGILPDGTYFVILRVKGRDTRELNAYLELRR
jgi:large repetitive protein